MASDLIMIALGRAVAAGWGELPTSVQRNLFDAAVKSAGTGKRKERAAYFHLAARA